MSAIVESVDGDVLQLVVDYQGSGELPYRVLVRDEHLPLAGVAFIESVPE
jgi:hypothetical protein